jgi:hypothetical protein
VLPCSRLPSRLANPSAPAVHFGKLTFRDVNSPLPDHRLPDQNQSPPSMEPDASEGLEPSGNNSQRTSSAVLIPAFDRGSELTAGSLHARFAEACSAWLARSPSQETRAAYTRELKQFLDFVGISDTRRGCVSQFLAISREGGSLPHRTSRDCRLDRPPRSRHTNCASLLRPAPK